MTIRRDEKVLYIDALEAADDNNPNKLVKLFSEIQKKNIQDILNYKSEQVKPISSLKEAAEILSSKVDQWKSELRASRKKVLDENRANIFNLVYKSIGGIRSELFGIIPREKAYISLQSVHPDGWNHYWYTNQIAEYATTHGYFFNRSLPRGWFKLGFKISEDRIYDLIITLHHFSYDDSILAIGSFLEFKENKKNEAGETTEDISLIPISIEPYTVSLEQNSTGLGKNINAYLNDIATVAVSHIANEIV